MIWAAMRHGSWLGLRNVVRDPYPSLCFAFAFCGTALPLLLLLALKYGLVGALTEELLHDPRHRELIAVGSKAYDAEFFEAARAVPEVAFIVPDTRNISARFTFARNLKARQNVKSLAIVPTANGDPLHESPPEWAKREVLVSTRAAEALALSPGEQFEGLIERTSRAGTRQMASVTLTVRAIVAPERLGSVSIMAPLPLLVAVENFLDDEAIQQDGWLLSVERQQFASFRAYARDIHRLEAASRGLQAAGASVKVRSDDAAAILRLDHLLGWLYIVVAFSGAIGFFVALAASLRANLERQRSVIGLLRMMGAPGPVRGAISLSQSLLIVGAGLCLTFAGFATVAFLVNAAFPDITPDRPLLALPGSQVATFAGVSVLLGLLAAIWSARASMLVTAEEGFRRC